MQAALGASVTMLVPFLETVALILPIFVQRMLAQ